VFELAVARCSRYGSAARSAICLVELTWQTTTAQPEVSVKMIAACNWGKLTGMIEQMQIPRAHGIGDNGVIYALDRGFFQVAPCPAAHGAKSNLAADVQQAAKSLGAALRDRCFVGRRPEASWPLLRAHSKETRAAYKPLTAHQWGMHGFALGRKARRRPLRAQGYAYSPVIRLSAKNWRRAF
jgi:hypothetical protein